MSLKSTIFKATLQIADMNRHYYQDHLLTVAKHPSETDERVMVRMLAFALNASAELVFANGLSESDEADIWLKDTNNSISLWIDVGLPDEKAIKKACNRAERVMVYSYGGRIAEVWWSKIKAKLANFNNLSVIDIPNDVSLAMAVLTARGMKLNYTISENHILLSNGKDSLEFEIAVLQ